MGGGRFAHQNRWKWEVDPQNVGDGRLRPLHTPPFQVGGAYGLVLVQCGVNGGT